MEQENTLYIIGGSYWDCLGLLFSIDLQGVAIVGEIPKGLPQLASHK